MQTLVFQCTVLLLALFVGKDTVLAIVSSPTITSIIEKKHNFFIAAEIAFAIWILPLLSYWIQTAKNRLPPITSLPFSIAAIIFACLSIGTSIRFFSHLSIACAFIALAPANSFSFLWLFGALSWMPALVWFSTKMGTTPFDPFTRIFLATLSILPQLYSYTPSKKQ